MGNTNENTRTMREMSFRITTGSESKSATFDFNNRYLFRIVVLPEGKIQETPMMRNNLNRTSKK